MIYQPTYQQWRKIREFFYVAFPSNNLQCLNTILPSLPLQKKKQTNKIL